MYYPSFYCNYYYQITLFNSQCLITNEESIFREIHNDLGVIVEEVFDSYLESKKDLFYHRNSSEVICLL